MEIKIEQKNQMKNSQLTFGWSLLINTLPSFFSFAKRTFHVLLNLKIVFQIGHVWFNPQATTEQLLAPKIFRI